MPAPEGNQNARRGKEYRLALRRALARKSGKDASTALTEVACRLVEAAYNGESWAIREIADRMDGRPAQAIVGDDELDPVSLVQKIELVGLDDL